MIISLKSYQVSAVQAVLDTLRDAAESYAATRHLNNPTLPTFSLTATTGAGKTIMAAAVIEALFLGNDDFNVDPDLTATVLWFSDDPSLNEQSKRKIEGAIDRLPASRLVTIDKDFKQDLLEPGRVYFLNTSQLSKNALLVRGFDSESEVRPDERGATFWDILRNTLDDKNRTVYMILDEAHRGMNANPTDERTTIVQRLINGQDGVPPMPIVWGISATVEKFEATMKGMAKRQSLDQVVVDPAEVQSSGLLKDDIVLATPDEKGLFDTAMLKVAVASVKQFTEEWHTYCVEQGIEDGVVPLLVWQVANSPDPEHMKDCLDAIYGAWGPGLEPSMIANVFGEWRTENYGRHEVPYIKPEDVQDSAVRVLLAKDAISTGWDCPRAEVLISFRPGKDRTYVTQLLGRMVRTPLARRIPGDSTLNEVLCYLPHFDEETVDYVVERLTIASGDEDTGGGPGRRVLLRPVLTFRNEGLPQSVWDAFHRMPSFVLPNRSMNAAKRLTTLAQYLATDGLLPGAVTVAQDALHEVMSECMDTDPEQFEEKKGSVLLLEAQLHRSKVGSKTKVSTRIEYDADARTVDDAYKATGRTLSPDVAGSFVQKLIRDEDDPEDALDDAILTVGALGLMPGLPDAVSGRAHALTEEWLDTYSAEIGELPDERQDAYDLLRASAKDPGLTDLMPPRKRREEGSIKKDGQVVPLPSKRLHLLVDDNGEYPLAPNLRKAERKVIDVELSEGRGTVAWYRNPGSSSKDSLAIPYQLPEAGWALMRPDFIFFTEVDAEVMPSIVDPHGAFLGDALPKLKGLADFAEKYGDRFHRIEAIDYSGEALRMLDMKSESVRTEVYKAASPSAVYSGDQAKDYE